jgi:hypothetical protein
MFKRRRSEKNHDFFYHNKNLNQTPQAQKRRKNSLTKLFFLLLYGWFSLSGKEGAGQMRR